MDPLVTGSLILGGAGLGGSWLSGSMNANEARRQRKFAAATMKNKYQWAVQDLIKAGINPLMAAMTGQPLASGSSATYPDFGQSLTSGVSSAVALKQAESNIKNIDINTEIASNNAKLTKDAIEYFNDPKNKEAKEIMRISKMASMAGLRPEIAVPMIMGLDRGKMVGRGYSSIIESVLDIFGSARSKGRYMDEKLFRLLEKIGEKSTKTGAMSLRESIKKSQDLYRYFYRQGGKIYEGISRWKPRVSINRGSKQ